MQGMVKFGRTFGLAYRLVDRQALDAGHRGIGPRAGRRTRKRPDQVAGGKHVFVHHPPRPVDAAVAPQAGRELEAVGIGRRAALNRGQARGGLQWDGRI